MGAIGRHERDARTEPSTRAGPLSATASRAATADLTRAAPTGRDALRHRVAAMSYRDGAAALRPRSRAPGAGPADACPDVAPFVASTGGVSTAVFTGLPVSAPRPLDPKDPPSPEALQGARDELAHWDSAARDAVTAGRDQAGRAARRFAQFAGAGVRDLKATSSRAGTIAALVFGTNGRLGGLLLGLVVDALATDPAADVDATLARALDRDRQASGREVEERWRDLRLAVVGATTVEALDRARDAIRRSLPGRLPGENQVYRDLLLAAARDGGMHLDGSDFNLRRRGAWWQSISPARAFGMDGRDVAAELNALGDRDPSTRANFDTERLP